RRELSRSELERFIALFARVMVFERRLPPEAGVPFARYLAEARAPGMELPLFWVRIKGEGRFLDSRAMLDAELERIRAEHGIVKVYEGPETGATRGEAHIEVYALHVGEHLQPLLVELAALGFAPSRILPRDGLSYIVDTGKEEKPARDLISAFELVQKECEKDVVVQRYKGLGEMQASQLYESTMDPERRTLYRVTINDAVEADRIFTVLMGPNVEPRREFIEKHALEATNLDI